MTSGTDYGKVYGKANAAYCRGDLNEAISTIDELAQDYPDDPHILLLRGHIFLSLHRYRQAQEQYENVLQLTEQSELVDYAKRGLQQIQQFQPSSDESYFDDSETEGLAISEANVAQSNSSNINNGDEDDFPNWSNESSSEWQNSPFEDMDWDNPIFADEDMGEPTIGRSSLSSGSKDRGSSNSANDDQTVQLSQSGRGIAQGEATSPWAVPAVERQASYAPPHSPSTSSLPQSAYGELENSINPFDEQLEDETDFHWHGNFDEDEQGHISFMDEEDQDGYNFHSGEANFDEFSDTGESTLVVYADLQGSSLKSEKNFPTIPPSANPLKESQDHYDNGWHEDAFNKESQHFKQSLHESGMNSRPLSPPSQHPVSSEGFLDDLEVFNEEDLDGLSQFDITDVAQSLPDSGLFDNTSDLDSSLKSEAISSISAENSSFSKINWSEVGENSSANLTGQSVRFIKPTVDVEQGKLAIFKNYPLRKKQWIIAGAAGFASVATIFLVSSAIWIFSPKQPTVTNKIEAVSSQKKPSTPNKNTEPKKAEKTDPKKSTTKTNTPSPAPSKAKADTPSSQPISPFSKSMLWMMLLTGGASFGATLFFARLCINQAKQSIDDLQVQFDSVYAGDFNVKATVYSEDELGQLSAKFNQMAQVILTTTSEAQRRAAETEQAKEDLQRQVIRLLDDVEGAARGDLTVEAEVTADVLGAVADAFNLTINNLREIVRQVKKAAEQVNRSSTDSESFARNQSSDALRMAEELAVTLNSVQMMTDSIQRVAENAREAEEVARTSSVTALRGGESVERTVAGILQIRETVSETARKVKRLAEASQEINKIVAVVSQIASRTNLLALNASIQAARAGEAGRGFAIVADEVRQLADRSAKSLKEIEQIVLQIQSETGSVMTAMEEGIQQVIDVTERSEQAKRSLEDIIQVSNRIDTLVRSITGDTVKQRENSREVAQVMQSVELTAQETSQESQRVAGSLQKLVKISQDLLESVERFKVDKNAHS